LNLTVCVPPGRLSWYPFAPHHSFSRNRHFSLGFSPYCSRPFFLLAGRKRKFSCYFPGKSLFLTNTNDSPAQESRNIFRGFLMPFCFLLPDSAILSGSAPFVLIHSVDSGPPEPSPSENACFGKSPPPGSPHWMYCTPQGFRSYDFPFFSTTSYIPSPRFPVGASLSPWAFSNPRVFPSQVPL